MEQGAAEIFWASIAFTYILYIHLCGYSHASEGTAAAGAKVKTQDSADACGSVGACKGNSLDTAATPRTKQHVRPAPLNRTATSGGASHRIPVHGKLGASEEELVQQVEGRVGPVGLLAGADQLLHH